MSPIQIYVYLRQSGFTHQEAEAFINGGTIPNLNTELKQKAIARLQEQKGVKK